MLVECVFLPLSTSLSPHHVVVVACCCLLFVGVVVVVVVVVVVFVFRYKIIGFVLFLNYSFSVFFSYLI